MADHASVEAFLDGLDPERREVVEVLRDTVRRGRPQLVEGIKWNSPNYALAGVDLLTLNVRNKLGRVQLVLHRGATRAEDRTRPPVLADDEGIVAWRSDVRGLVAFADRQDAVDRAPLLDRVVTRWIALP
jgi:hypothetical protein